jgi:hypothetical protein
MKGFRYHRLYGFHLYLSVVYVAIFVSCKSFAIETHQQIESATTWEKKAIEAVKAQKIAFSDMQLYARKIKDPLLKKTMLYQVWVGKDMSPMPVFTVALGEDGSSYVFDQYHGYRQHTQFSKVMEMEGLNIEEANAKAFVEVLLLMLGGGSSYIPDIADIRGAWQIQKELQKYQGVVTPMAYSVVAHDRRLITFYAWHYSNIEHWSVEIKPNGVVVKCEVKDVAEFKVPGLL